MAAPPVLIINQKIECYEPKIQFALLSEETEKYEEGALMPICMRVSVGGKKTEFTTQHEWDPTKWSSSACRASGTKEASKELNAFLDTLQTKVYEAQRKLVADGEVVSTDTIREIITGRNRNPKMLLEVFDYHNKQMQELVDIDFAPGTMERYQTERSHTKYFIKWKYGLIDSRCALDELN